MHSNSSSAKLFKAFLIDVFRNTRWAHHVIRGGGGQGMDRLTSPFYQPSPHSLFQPTQFLGKPQKYFYALPRAPNRFLRPT